MQMFYIPEKHKMWSKTLETILINEKEKLFLLYENIQYFVKIFFIYCPRTGHQFFHILKLKLNKIENILLPWKTMSRNSSNINI